MTAIGLLRPAMMNPDVVKIPMPIILAITTPVAENGPISRWSRLLMKLTFIMGFSIHRNGSLATDSS